VTQYQEWIVLSDKTVCRMSNKRNLCETFMSPTSGHWTATLTSKWVLKQAFFVGRGWNVGIDADVGPRASGSSHTEWRPWRWRGRMDTCSVSYQTEFRYSGILDGAREDTNLDGLLNVSCVIEWSWTCHFLVLSKVLSDSEHAVDATATRGMWLYESGQLL
jgi:hypothetical protein